MQTPYPILVADVGELLSGLAPIIFVILYGIAHLVGSLQQEKRKPPVRPRPRPAPQDLGERPRAGGGAAAAGGAGGNQPNLEETLRREVEEFLRRAQGQPQQAKPAQPRPQQLPPQQRPAAQRPTAPSPRSAGQPERPVAPTRRLVETTRTESTAAPIEPLRQTMGAPPVSSGSPSHVGDPLRTQNVTQHALAAVAQHAQQLGAEVAQADERMEQHLRERFVHQVGALTPRTPSGQRQAAANSAAQELRNLLGRPGGTRQLIIAGEILRRPEERWDR